MKIQFGSEGELADLALGELRRHGFRVGREIPSMGKSVDIAATRNTDIFLFEAKLNDWRRALRQAEPHLFVADFVLVVVPDKRYSPEFFDIASSLGIGVIAVKPESRKWRIMVRPKKSELVWPPQRERFRQQMELILDGH